MAEFDDFVLLGTTTTNLVVLCGLRLAKLVFVRLLHLRSEYLTAEAFEVLSSFHSQSPVILGDVGCKVTPSFTLRRRNGTWPSSGACLCWQWPSLGMHRL